MAVATKEHAVERLLGHDHNVIFDELVEEAQNYRRLVEQLKALPEESSERDELENQLFRSISHLSMHAGVLQETILEAIDGLPEDAEA